MLAAAKVVLKEFISGAGEQVALDELNDLPAFNGMKPTHPMSAHLTAALRHLHQGNLPRRITHVIGNPVINQSLISGAAGDRRGKMTPEAAMQAVQETALAQQKAH